MPLLNTHDLEFSVGHQVLLDKVNLQLDEGERVCLVGHNGSGKSTLLAIVEGNLQADAGSVRLQPGIQVASMPQSPLVVGPGATVFEAVAQGLEAVGELLARFHQLSHGDDMDALATVQEQLEAADGWSFHQKIESTLARLNLDGEQAVSELSGGWRRRVALARALVAEPDILLLDEPTNHLDIAAIEWLEQAVLDYRGCVLFITHDRALIDKLATRIVLLDRGHLHDYPGNFSEFQVRRDEDLRIESEQNALFDKRLAEEERWIRTGVKARRTRNEGRVRALKKLRDTYAQRRNVQGSARLSLEQGDSSGKIVAELSRVSHGYGDNILIRDFDLGLMRGDKLALIGPNGAGKTTLLRILLGELAPDNGKVRQGSKLQVAYFDQMRSVLDENKTVIDVVGQGRESITINGKQKHIISYLGDFLFTAERARSQIRVLSGGERARVILALLFSQPANVLVLDEPTNDLDMETLELLEELLIDFEGTVLLVSHDRAFVDNVASACLLFEGDGRVDNFVGGYSNIPPAKIEAAFSHREKARPVSAPACATVDAAIPSEPKKPAIKLSYKIQRELDNLPATISALEAEIAALNQRSQQADFGTLPHSDISAHLAAMAEKQLALDTAVERWLELSEDQ
ncbi:MAG: ATP-binding cassette subfamily F protein uup [Bermanella sp.]|jgi:ATP-binding cassette subfamily F protein uup